MSGAFSLPADILRVDAARETERIIAGIRDIVLRRLNRKGVVVGLCGGIDSSVVASLCARALGQERVLALLMPGPESSPDSVRLGRLLADTLGVQYLIEDINSILSAAQYRKRRDEAVRRVVPEYGTGFECRVVLPSVHDPEQRALFSVIVRSPDGTTKWVRMSPEAYLRIVAAGNFKQRAQTMLAYYYADLFQYAVAGTHNRLEYDQGLFVKCGDGAADLKPLAHLYQSQVCQLADYLGVPEEIRLRPPDPGTYPLEHSREEFYFLLPQDKMDLCLYGKNAGIPAEILSASIGLETDQVRQVYAAIHARRKAARYLHAAPLLVEEVAEV